MEGKFDRRDLIQCENLIKALKKAKFDLDGMEVLAFAEVMRWVNGIYNRIQADVVPAESPKPTGVASMKEVKSPIEEAPKTAVPVKPIKTSKKIK
jgi:hypothetical protein